MSIPSVQLSNGLSIPALGLGSSPEFGGYGHEATVYAIQDCGIRLIDTAACYKTESDVGNAIKDAGIPRKDLFVSTKMQYTEHGYKSAKAALHASLRALDLEYLDLYLIHWPHCPDGTANATKSRLDTWRAFEESYEQGLCKAIGVSNYEISHLEELKDMKVKPHVNQIEFHPMRNPNSDVVKYCRDAGITIMGYSPFCACKVISQSKVIEVAKKHKQTAGQVLLRWSIQHNVVPIPKTSKIERAKENAQVFNFKLSDEDMALLNSIHTESPFHLAASRGWPYFN